MPLVPKHRFLFLLSKFLIGPAGMVLGATMVWHVPERSELFDLPSYGVSRAAFFPAEGLPSKVKLYDDNNYCVTIKDDHSGFWRLRDAIRDNARYTVRYSKEAALFGDPAVLYPIVYEIAIGDEVVQSFDNRTLAQRVVWTIIFLVSLTMVVSADYYLRNGVPERMS